MKKFTLLMAILLPGLIASAQTDSTAVSDSTHAKNDTIRVGNILIIKKGGKGSKEEKGTSITMGRSNTQRNNSKVSTNWFIFDLGFANYDDQTDYTNTGNFLVNKPGTASFGKGDFKLRTGKSVNVNIWIVMQKLSLAKNYVNLKYGLGLELNNYRFKSPISFKENGVLPYSGGMQTNEAFIFEDSISFSKNKLAADYLTVPLMLNFNSNPNHPKKGISLSAGVSAGYLYSQRNKQVSDSRGKQKNKGEYDLEKFKLSYIAELGLGPVRLYGSYSPKSIFDHSLDIRPYNVGLRFSNW